MFERFKWIWVFLALLLLGLALVAPVGGRKDNPRSAWPAEEKYSGTVEAVNQHTCEICKGIELSVILKTSGGLQEVRLGPKRFFEQHDFYLSRGDAIEVYGVAFAERGKEIVLANELVKGGESLLVRGKYGKPAWLDVHAHTCPVCGN